MNVKIKVIGNGMVVAVSECKYCGTDLGSGTAEWCNYECELQDINFSLTKENADLRAKLEQAEVRKKVLSEDIVNLQDVIACKNDERRHVSQENILLRRERAELSGKIRQLELQVMVMRRALELSKRFIDTEPLDEDSLSIQEIVETNRAIVNALSTTTTEVSQKLQEFEQYAELGRLVLNGNPCYFGYEFADGDCASVVCSDNEKKVCNLRAELKREG